MYKCASCSEEFRDGAQCSVCLGHFDFACGGITETGFRRLGDRKSTWRCPSCKKSSSPMPPTGDRSNLSSPVPANMDDVLAELRRLSLQVALLPGLDAAVKNIKGEISALKTIQPELADIKSSIEFVDQKIVALSSRLSEMEKDIQTLQKTKNDVDNLQLRVEKLEAHNRELEQRSRLNNLEIKGVPASNSENLFDVLSKIGRHIHFDIPKEQINYIARVPMRNSKDNKNIVVSVHSRYIKDDFVAAAKKSTITPATLGMSGNNRIYVNDHLTIENKILLNKTKALAKDRGFSFTWVRGCKIFVRKNENSPKIQIRSDVDFTKI